MNDPQQDSILTEERLAWDQICEQHPDQWVALAHVDWINAAKSADVRTAIVIGHGTRDHCIERRQQLRSHFDEIACQFTGPPRVIFCSLYRPIEWVPSDPLEPQPIEIAECDLEQF
jgi:hypothetical protein